MFPEPLNFQNELLDGTPQIGLRFNLFFPWMINEDGTEMETLNHIGRHELHRFFYSSFSDDPVLQDFVTTNRHPSRTFCTSAKTRPRRESTWALILPNSELIHPVSSSP